MQETNREKTAEIMIGGKTENKTTDSNATEQQQLEEIPLKELAKDKTESSKNVKESKAGKIDPSSKTRRSSKSPLLEKLLSPGRRSRRSQKDKTKTENSKTTGLTEDLAGESASKSEDNAKKEMKTYAEKLADSSKITEVEATKSKGKTEDGRKKPEKTESSKGEVKANEAQHENEALSTVTGPFDVFKFGGKKSK